MKKIISEIYNIFDIPVITFYNENLKSMPLIFLIHGFDSKKEIHTDMAWNLAEKGFFAVIIDAKFHGKRKDENFNSMKYEDQISKLLEIVYSTTQDLKTLINHFSNIDKINIKKIGITGNSMGGILSCYAGSILDEITVIVSVNGSPSWIDLGNYLIHTNRNFSKILDYEDKFLLENDPDKNLFRFSGKKMFLLNGEFDEVMPFIFSKRFYEKIISKKIIDKNDFIFSLYPVKHSVSPQMKEDIYSWFQNKL